MSERATQNNSQSCDLCGSRCGLHFRVFPVSAWLAQLCPRFLVLSALSQEHVLCEGILHVYALSRAPLLTYVRINNDSVKKREIKFFRKPLTPPSDEGWPGCKVRPPCSERDYFQIHSACDSDGKVSGGSALTFLSFQFYSLLFLE